MKKISLIITQILLFGGIFSLVGCGAPTPIESTETLPQTELTEETQTTEHAAESTLPSTFEEAKALISNPFAPFLKVVSTTGSSQSAIETNILYKSDNGKISIANTIATQQDITEKKF
ncbi:MAG: hypothetical protein LBO09_08955 [Candidatus Peribacteria bacterium]|jgi:hypothetical protein|nr:hypothetical protein [Candidatus Peribacteria bacterium]